MDQCLGRDTPFSLLKLVGPRPFDAEDVTIFIISQQQIFSKEHRSWNA